MQNDKTISNHQNRLAEVGEDSPHSVAFGEERS
jgi:hypothetical protein